MKKFLVAVLVLTACQSVPYTNRRALLLVSPAEEAALGESSYREALSKAKLSTDAAENARLQRVGARLAKAANKPEYKWEFALIDDPKTVNAWCLPGGKVAVYTGLLPVSRDDAGLAVVLGHEIAHALARHGSERMSQGLLAQLGGAALTTAMSQKPAATQKMAQQAYFLGANVGVLLPFSRAHESEADHIGLLLMADAGYDPETAIGFWQRMAKAGGGGPESPLDKYLRTHPTDERRIADIRGWLPEARARAPR